MLIAGYNPAYKYNLIYEAMVHNCNAITKVAEGHQTVDETTWGHAGFAETGTGLAGRLMNKKVNKGGQITIMTDSKRFRPRAFIHRHKLHEPLGMTRRGTIELCHLIHDIDSMIIEEDTPTPPMPPLPPPPATTSRLITKPRDPTKKKIFRGKPIITADNFFFDDKMCEFIGENGYGSIGTNARNVLPKGIDKKHLHGEKHQSGCKYSKVARYTKPIVAVKEEAGYQRVHVSFQSTNATNITTVNCLNEVNLFVELRERGRGENRRVWGIEMNDARRLYLSTYFRIDVVDHLLKNAAIFYRTWKYWHAPKNHGFAMCIVLAYGIYEECCEGKIESDWKIEKKKMMNFFQFRARLSSQMLTYSPRKLVYPGDDRMRAVTSIPKERRGGKRSGKVTLMQVKRAKRWSTSRLCGDLDKLSKHADSIISVSKSRVCAWCGEPSYTLCGKCKDENGKQIPLHYNPKGARKGAQCFYHYHNDTCFGLGKNDCSLLLKGKKGDWEPPSTDDIAENAQHVSNLQAIIGQESTD